MPDLIIYHYAMSPFSQKIRTMLGYSGLPWRSVTVSEMPPRPELEVLAGGYRKIPVAQLGADIFCDSRTIAREIARQADLPGLVVEQQPEAVRNFVAEADLDLFLACVISASDLKMLRQLIRATSLWGTFRFLKDRINIGRKAKVKAVGGAAARQKVLDHIARLEQQLEQDFLFGPAPCIADFSAYHGLWFACDLAGKPWLRDYPRVSAWMDRMKAFGEGQPAELAAQTAIGEAKASQPRALPGTSHHPLQGQTVSVAPSDYGRDPVTGTLVYADDDVVILSRQTPETGLLHIHFPTYGFRIKPVEG